MQKLTSYEVMRVAIEHHRAGRLAEAEKMYHQVLLENPRNAAILHLMGLSVHQQGRSEAALRLIRDALAIAPDNAVYHCNLGVVLRQLRDHDQAISAFSRAIFLRPAFAEAHNNLATVLASNGMVEAAIQSFRTAIRLKGDYTEAYFNYGNALRDKGQFNDAIAAYRNALALKSNWPEAQNSLGNALIKIGRIGEAIAAYRQALAIRPDYAEALYNLGVALNDDQQVDKAIAAYREAIAVRPNYAQAYCNLGNLIKDKGEVDEAIAAYRQALVIDPDLPEAHMNLGTALRERGQLDGAIAAHRQAIALRPCYADALSNLGLALKDAGRLEEAIGAFREALLCNRNFPEVFSNLGNALRENGQLDEAIAAYRNAIALVPTLAEAHCNLGNALRDKGELDEAISAYSQAIALNPKLPEVYNNLGNALLDTGNLDEAIATYRQALSIYPDSAAIHSNLIFSLHFHANIDARSFADEHLRWDRQHGQPLRRFIQPHCNDCNGDRRLRIGYVSPDFRDHVVGRNLLPLLRQHDRRQFEITCYANELRSDSVTREIEAHADRWRNIVGVSDGRVAEQVRADGIDILVDAALHTANNRLLVFAHRPAPIQVTFAGYPGSTGLRTIDYRLSDRYLDPPIMDESVYSEQTIRLPGAFWCYDPLECRQIPVNSLPALEMGTITFGCLSNFFKVNRETLKLWCEVLRQVKNSQLLLLAPEGSHRQRASAYLGEQGIDPERVQFAARRSRQAYMELYHRVDLGLDSFPYNGHTTSLDSFWMGVPVVTRMGERVVSRAGWCQVSNLELRELAGETPEQFVQIAVELAGDLPRLKGLRSTLRQRMERSPLMDALGFARNIEAAYRQIWRRRCEAGAK